MRRLPLAIACVAPSFCRLALCCGARSPSARRPPPPSSHPLPRQYAVPTSRYAQPPYTQERTAGGKGRARAQADGRYTNSYSSCGSWTWRQITWKMQAPKRLPRCASVFPTPQALSPKPPNRAGPILAEPPSSSPYPFSPLCPRLCFPRPSHWLAAAEPATLSVPLCLCACKTQLPPGARRQALNGRPSLVCV